MRVCILIRISAQACTHRVSKNWEWPCFLRCLLSLTTLIARLIEKQSRSWFPFLSISNRQIRRTFDARLIVNLSNYRSRISRALFESENRVWYVACRLQSMRLVCLSRIIHVVFLPPTGDSHRVIYSVTVFHSYRRYRVQIRRLLFLMFNVGYDDESVIFLRFILS